MKRFHWGILVTVVGAITLLLSGCASTKTTTKNGQIQVVSSVDFYGEAAKAVLGNHGHVTTIINNPSIDPHDYEPTPAIAKEVAKANFVIVNGLGYDGWANKLADSSGHVKIINVGADLLKLKNGDNPHVWYRMDTMPALAKNLATQFGRQDPKYKADFKRNADRFIATLKPVQAKINHLKVTTPQKVDVSEPVFDYQLEALGYKVNNPAFERAVQNETDPSPAAIHAMQQDIKQHKIAFFVNNIQASDKVVKNLVALAKQSGVPVLQVTETKPRGLNYQQWMMSQLTQLATIQKQLKTKS